MKLMIASDIHGSAFYCEQMIEAYKREGADKLFFMFRYAVFAPVYRTHKCDSRSAGRICTEDSDRNA